MQALVKRLLLHANQIGERAHSFLRMRMASNRMLPEGIAEHRGPVCELLDLTLGILPEDMGVREQKAGSQPYRADYDA